MAEIKNNAGQIFANFDEWKKWAESPSERWEGRQNILPELVEFLSSYPWIVKGNKNGAEQAEDFSNSVRDLLPDEEDSRLLRKALNDVENRLRGLGYVWIDDCYNFFRNL